ncbi:MAG: cytochrome c [Halioglobus sp.]
MFSYHLKNVALVVLSATIAHAQAEQEVSYGIGRPVANSEIAAWDKDVRPDGRGLPAGSGTVAMGEQLYGEKCVACHGASGIGGPFDQLAGRIAEDAFPFATDPSSVKTIGNYWPYATTLFDYINRAMPYDAPGSLNTQQVYGLVAYLLHLNKIVPADATLSQDNLAKIIMPAQHRFVPDARRGGAEVR